VRRPKAAMMNFHVGSESEAVREWEAKINQHRQEVKHAKEEKEHEHDYDHDHDHEIEAEKKEMEHEEKKDET
jgi:hypothetical protein